MLAKRNVIYNYSNRNVKISVKNGYEYNWYVAMRLASNEQEFYFVRIQL